MIIDKASKLVTLREITRDNLDQVLGLAVHKDQEQFVATNAKSLAQAHFTPTAWYRAIYAGEIPVGFVMLNIDPPQPLYYLWRFMIDVRHQREGYGVQALRQVTDYIRTQYPAAPAITLSYEPSNLAAERLYKAFGFVLTDKFEGGENTMRLDLA